MASIDFIRDRDHAAYFTDDASMTVEIDMDVMGMVMRFEVDVTYFKRDFSKEIVVTAIEGMRAIGAFEGGYNGTDYATDRPRPMRLTIDPDHLTEEEAAQARAEAAASIRYELNKDEF